MTAQLFISTVTGTLDGKGRVCIPSGYRDALTAQATAGVYVRPSFLDTSLEGFGDALMQRYQAAQAAKDPFLGSDIDEMVFAVLSSTQLLPRDENGRVRLPDEFIAHAGLKDRVTFSGVGDRFQIWEPEAFAAMRAEKVKRAAERHAAAKAGGA
jgi:MraZ protein